MAAFFVLVEEALREEIEERKRQRQILRNSFRINVVPDLEFISNYRLSRTLFEELCADIVPLMPRKRRCDGIDPTLKILTALNFYGRGSYQGSVGLSSDTPMAQQTVSECLRDVTIAINHHTIVHKYIRFPQNLNERNDVKRQFYDKFGLPGVIGCIDCTHVALIRPTQYEERFFNRKHFHSLNVQVICDAECMILSVDASYGGASHDSFIWGQHEIKAHLENLQEETVYLLGKIVIACCVLTNMCNQANLDAPELSEEDLQEERDRQGGNLVVPAHQALQQGHRGRNRLVHLLERTRLSLLWLLLISLLSSLMADNEHQGSQNCGGRLKGPYGIIQTPNFPKAFPVPIKCKWIIDHDITNGTISIYFTQQYTTSGLTFTEYMYYDDTYKLGERKAFQVTEENITKVKMIQMQSPVLVVELSLTALEGTQLRALGLLSVYGLNVTYAVHAPVPLFNNITANTCSALDCRLLGHCFASKDFQKFFCSCFEGYTGSDCGVGPLCVGASNMCKHGGTCRHMGPAAVSCVCAPGFSGDLCEVQISTPKCELEECSDGCKHTNKCDCSPRDDDSTLARFETRLPIMDQGNPNISQELLKEMTTYLSAYLALKDDIEILNISTPDRSGERSAHVRVWAEKEAQNVLRSTLEHFSTLHPRSDRVRMLPASLQIDVQPALTLLALAINQQRPEIWEGSEFILTCTAYGSSDITFTWYKDGIKINFNGTIRDIWTRTIAEDEVGQTTSVLEMSQAQQIDSGRWSCVAYDGGRRRCKAIYLTVLSPPDIRLLPSALTVNKGDNVSITCLTDARRSHGALGFSWARDRTLLRLAPGQEVWEDLYPTGSVLKLYNVQKSGEFRCQVSSVAGTSAKGVTMWALGTNDEACNMDTSHGIRWYKTAPGAHTFAPCPTGYSGEVTRFCEPKTIQHGIKWKSPDFSACVDSALKLIYEEFRRISFGYSWKSIINITSQYEKVLSALPLHPGEGSVALHHMREILNFLLSVAAKQSDKIGCVENLLKIYDTLLKHPDNFLDEEKVYELQNALIQTAGMRDGIELNLHEFSVMSRAARDYNVASFKLQPVSTGNENWFLTSAGVELVRGTRNAVVVAARYNSLAAKLPSLKSSTEFKGGAELEYLISSQHLQLSATGAGINPSLPHTVTLTFSHVFNYSAIVSKLACAVRSLSEPSVWRTKACEVRIPEPTNVACQCRGLGTFALFTVARSTLTHTEKDLRGVVKVTVGVGGALCLAATALQMLGLMPIKKTRLPVLLKAATAGTHSAAMFTLLECDTGQEEACPGTLGWLCALCWCAGCAALCAQPLLLQQELAGRALHAPSVGLLAGVCTLAWLTARLWGGAPLQLGTAAQVVCAAGCSLLAVLCFALTVCASLRLSIVTHKVPIERMKYLKDRQRVIRHTLVLLLTTSAVQVAGVAYAQPGERETIHVAVLAATAITNGVAMMVCYVFYDKECMAAVKRAFSLNLNQDWEDDSRAGDTSLSLYIKQAGEVDSRGGVDILESSPSHLSSIDSYWKAPGLESPDAINRRQSEPDTRADIVRCVEYAECAMRHNARYGSHVGTTRAVCDLVPRASPQPSVRATQAFLEPTVVPPLVNSIAAPCPCTSSTPATPDLSVDQPIKSCLRNPIIVEPAVPTIEVMEEPKSKADIEQVNREWNKAYDLPDTDKVLNKISSDLDFLLNRTLERKNVLDEIEEAPT